MHTITVVIIEMNPDLTVSLLMADYPLFFLKYVTHYTILNLNLP